MNTDIRKIAKNVFENDFFKLIMYFWKKSMENERKHINIEFETTEARRNYLVSEPNYHTTNYFSENLLAIEMKRTSIHK